MATTKQQITTSKPEPKAGAAKNEFKDIILPKQSLIFTGIGEYHYAGGEYHNTGGEYHPIPHFRSGCKQC